jgi:DNA transformation protein
MTETKKQKLTDLPNLGKIVARQLEEVGIHTPEELREIGTEQAFIRLTTIDPTSCLHKLMALEGAIQGIRKYDLPRKRKDELKAFFQMQGLHNRPAK